MNWGLGDIVEATGGRLLYGEPRQCFEGIGIDSRTVAPGSLFVAIRGATHDAHKFLPQVVAKGIRGLVVQEQTGIILDHDAWKAQGTACVAVKDTTRALGALAAFQRQRMRIPLVAVTGSNGKTTTRRMIALVLAQRYKTLTTEGNFNNEIGLPLTLFRLTREHQAAVVELGINHPGEMDRLGAICKPTVAVFTNVGPAHLEFLGSVQGVARAKGELLPHIDPKGYAVLNMDDEHVAALAKLASCSTLFFGTAPEADVRAESIVDGPGGITFRLILPDDRMDIHLPTPGRFMVYNALAAAASGYLSNLKTAEIKAGLEKFRPVQGRLNITTAANGVHIIDDTYNANPASMAAAIDTFVVSKGAARGFMVLGDMLELGPQADVLHYRVGELAANAGVEKLYACGDHAEDVLAGARHKGMAARQLAAASKEEIERDLIRILEPGDWLLEGLARHGHGAGGGSGQPLGPGGCRRS